MSLRVGDWVTNCGTGFWRVHRVLDHRAWDPRTGGEFAQRLVFVTRFLSKSLKRSFTEDCCDESLIRPLDVAQRHQLDDFIAANPELLRKFDAYQPKPQDTLFTARVGVPADRDADPITRALAGGGELTVFEIGPTLRGLGLKTGAVPYWLVQFLCEDYACRDGYLRYKFLRVLAS